MSPGPLPHPFVRATLRLSLALVALVALTFMAACSKRAAVPDPIRAVRTIEVTTTASDVLREYAAEVRPRTESTLGFRVGGKLTERLVDVGERVRRGQVLARLDARDLVLAQDAARAQLRSAQATFDQTDADLRRFEDLKQRGFISAAEFDRRATEQRAARARLDEALAQERVQVNQSGYAALLADADGVVTRVDAEPGAVLAAGTPVLRVARDGPRDVVFAVPEDQVDAVRALVSTPGALVARLWGDDRETLPLRLREIAAAADPATRTFLIKADLNPAAGRSVQIGQTATVILRLSRLQGMARLPLSALREEGGRTAVWIVDPASRTVRSQVVEVAAADGNDALIATGLSPGALVVSAGVHVLSAGQQVTLYADPLVAPAASAASSRAVR